MEQQTRHMSLLEFMEALDGPKKAEGSPVLDTLTYSGRSESVNNEFLREEEFSAMRENLLHQTISDAFGLSRGGRKRKPSTEAWEWIISNEGKLPFSFDRCCDDAGVNPEKMEGLLRWYRRKMLT